MKLIVTADWHIRATKPRCRIDEDWIQTQQKALDQIVQISNKKRAPVFVVGDLFHSNSDTSFQCIQIVQQMADQLGELYVLCGNHDLPVENDGYAGARGRVSLQRCRRGEILRQGSHMGV